MPGQFLRLFARAALIIAFLAAIAIPSIVIFVRGANTPETWAVAAASLAVITSVISTWSSQRILELQEDALRPSPNPAFDFTSRYGLAMLRVTNTGAAAAYDVHLEWDVDLIDHKGKKIGFSRLDDNHAISVLLPNESVAQIIDAPHSFLKRLPASDFTGRIFYRDVTMRNYARHFRLSARQYEGTPTHDEELPKTLVELQKVPAELKKIRQILEKQA